MVLKNETGYIPVSTQDSTEKIHLDESRQATVPCCTNFSDCQYLSDTRQCRRKKNNLASSQEDAGCCSANLAKVFDVIKARAKSAMIISNSTASSFQQTHNLPSTKPTSTNTMFSRLSSFHQNMKNDRYNRLLRFDNMLLYFPRRGQNYTWYLSTYVR